MAVHADSNQRSLHQRLGRMLVGAGLLSAADLRRALALQKERGGRLGQVLVAECRVRPDDLHRALNLQFLQIIYGVLRWDDGAYDFERCAIAAERGDIEPVSFQSILMDGMRMIDEWPLIEKRLANRKAILQRIPREEPAAAAAGPDLGLEGLEAEVYERVDGKSSIQQIIDRSMRLEFDVCRALYDLGERGLVGPAYEGQLAEADFPDLLLAVLRAKASGRLELARGTSRKTVIFSAGEIAGAESSDPDDDIGPFLLRRGAIGRRDLEQTAAAAPGNVGEELVRCGAIERAQVDRQRGEHATELVLSLFSWTEGTYRFRPGAPAAVPAALAGRTAAIVLRGIQATDRWSRIARAAGPLETVYRRCGASGGPGPWDALPDEHLRILDLFAGGLSVRSACERGEVPEHFLHQLLWAGRVLGLHRGAAASERRPLAGRGAERRASPAGRGVRRGPRPRGAGQAPTADARGTEGRGEGRGKGRGEGRGKGRPVRPGGPCPGARRGDAGLLLGTRRSARGERRPGRPRRPRRGRPDARSRPARAGAGPDRLSLRARRRPPAPGRGATIGSP